MSLFVESGTITSGEELLRRFLVSKRKERTREAYNEDIEDFHRYLRGANPTGTLGDTIEALLGRGPEAAVELIQGYVQDLRSRTRHTLEVGLSSSTIARRLTALRGVLRYAYDSGVVDWAVRLEVPKREKRKDTRGPRTEDLQMMLNYLRGRGSVTAIRDCAIIRLITDRAMRRQQIAFLRVEDVDILGCRIRYCVGRAQTPEWRALPTDTALAIRDWLNVREGEPIGPLFTNFDRKSRTMEKRALTVDGVYLIVKRTAERAGVKYSVWPDSIRRSAVTSVVKAISERGLPITYAQKFAGHASASTTLSYTNQVGDEDDVTVRIASASSG